MNYDIYLNNQEIYASKTSSKASGFRFVNFFDDDDDDFDHIILYGE